MSALQLACLVCGRSPASRVGFFLATDPGICGRLGVDPGSHVHYFALCQACAEAEPEARNPAVVRSLLTLHEPLIAGSN